MTRTIKVVMCPANQRPYIKSIRNSLHAMQNAVGGYIEMIELEDNLVIVCNEEGRLLGLPANKSIMMPGLVGNCFIASASGEDLTDCSDIQLILDACMRSWLRNY